MGVGRSGAIEGIDLLPDSLPDLHLQIRPHPGGKCCVLQMGDFLYGQHERLSGKAGIAAPQDLGRFAFAVTRLDDIGADDGIAEGEALGDRRQGSQGQAAAGFIDTAG